MIDKKSFILGFLEAKISFSFTIFHKSDERKDGTFNKSLFFNPYITIASTHKDHINFIKKYFSFDVTKPNLKKQLDTHRGKELLTFSIQNRDDVDKVISLLDQHEFICGERKKSYDTFKETYKLCKEVGFVGHKTYDKKFDKIILMKDKINNTYKKSKTRLSGEEWIKISKEHLANTQ